MLLTDEEITKERLLTLGEMEKCQEVAFISSGKDNDAYQVMFNREQGVLSGRKVAKAQLKKVADKITFSHRGIDGWVCLAMKEEDYRAMLEEIA